MKKLAVILFSFMAITNAHAFTATINLGSSCLDGRSEIKGLLVIWESVGDLKVSGDIDGREVIIKFPKEVMSKSGKTPNQLKAILSDPSRKNFNTDVDVECESGSANVVRNIEGIYFLPN